MIVKSSPARLMRPDPGDAYSSWELPLQPAVLVFMLEKPTGLSSGSRSQQPLGVVGSGGLTIFRPGTLVIQASGFGMVQRAPTPPRGHAKDNRDDRFPHRHTHLGGELQCGPWPRREIRNMISRWAASPEGGATDSPAMADSEIGCRSPVRSETVKQLLVAPNAPPFPYPMRIFLR